MVLVALGCSSLDAVDAAERAALLVSGLPGRTAREVIFALAGEFEGSSRGFKTGETVGLAFAVVSGELEDGGSGLSAAVDGHFSCGGRVIVGIVGVVWCSRYDLGFDEAVGILFSSLGVAFWWEVFCCASQGLRRFTWRHCVDGCHCKSAFSGDFSVVQSLPKSEGCPSKSSG